MTPSIALDMCAASPARSATPAGAMSGAGMVAADFALGLAAAQSAGATAPVDPTLAEPSDAAPAGDATTLPETLARLIAGTDPDAAVAEGPMTSPQAAVDATQVTTATMGLPTGTIETTGPEADLMDPAQPEETMTGAATDESAAVDLPEILDEDPAADRATATGDVAPPPAALPEAPPTGIGADLEPGAPAAPRPVADANPDAPAPPETATAVGAPIPVALPGTAALPTTVQDTPMPGAPRDAPTATVTVTVAEPRQKPEQAMFTVVLPQADAPIADGRLPLSDLPAPAIPTDAQPAPAVGFSVSVAPTPYQTAMPANAPPVLSMAQPDWPGDLAAMLGDSATLRRLGAGEMLEIRLDPETLGPVTLRLELRDGTANVAIVTQTPEAARLFNDNQQRLADAMARAGIDLGSHSAGTGDGRGGQRPDDGRGPVHAGGPATPDTPTDPTPTRPDAGPVRRIDLFA